MKAKRVNEFKNWVENLGFKYNADDSHMKKLSAEEAEMLMEKLMARNDKNFRRYNTLESHIIGEWVGMSLTNGDDSNEGISESIMKKGLCA